MKLTVQISDIDMLDTVLEHNIARVYIKNLQKPIKCKAELFLALPNISHEEHIPNIDVDGYLVSTYGQLYLLQNTDKKIMLDYTFNIFNNQAKQAFPTAVGTTLSQELNLKQLKEMDGQNSEIIIHGRQILMTTRAKFPKDSVLTDRKNMQFPIMQNGNLNYILNSKTLNTAARLSEIKSANIEYMRIIFQNESRNEIKNTLLQYEGLPQVSDNYTYGHFFRGAD